MRALVALLLLVLALCLAACGGLGSEPRIVATIPPATPTPEEVGHPVTAPNMAMGASLFAQHCTECHGITGGGDGSLVLAGQVTDAGNFQNPDTARSQMPKAWFDTITNGRIERLMPPWRDALTEEQRWSVALYTYTLNYTQEQLTRGAALWADLCADCSTDAFTDQALMANLSDDALLTALTTGAEQGILALSSDLDEQDRRAVVAYVRSLSVANAGMVGYEQIAQPPAATAEPGAEATQPASESASGTISIGGAVVNGSAGGTVPPGLELTLFVFTAETVEQYPATADASGAYTFADVPLISEATYVVTTAYRDRVYTSEFRQGSQLTGNPAALPVAIYELTEDPDVIEITGIATQVNVTDNGLEVAQVLSVANHSDRAFSTSQNTPDGRPISLVLPLPPGAVVAGFTEQGRYMFVQESFTVLDTAPVLPGEDHLVQLVYLIEYGGDAIIEQEIDYSVNGPVRLLVSPENVRVQSDQLTARGVETVGTGQYASYGADLSVRGGSLLRYELSGRGGASALSGAETVVTSNNLLPVVLGVIAVEIVVIGFLVYSYRRRRTRAAAASAAPRPSSDALNTPVASTPTAESLLAQIAGLDAAYEAGEIEEAAYQRQRAVLKARLAALMRD